METGDTNKGRKERALKQKTTDDNSDDDMMIAAVAVAATTTTTTTTYDFSSNGLLSGHYSVLGWVP